MGWDDDKDTPLKISAAMDSGDIDEMRALLTAHPEFLRHDDGEDAWLWSEARSGNLDAVKLLVELGVDVNEEHNGDRPIDSATGAGQLEVVRWLIEHGAIIQHEVNGRMYSRPMMNAAIGGYLDVMKLLVEHGANPHSHWHGVNTLMHAEFYGHEDVAKYLRSLGVKDLRETTPPNYPEAHRRLLKHMTDLRGPLSEWTLEMPGEPHVTLHHIPVNEQCDDEQTLFTIGLSDHRLPDEYDAFAATELRLTLPPDWPLTDEALHDPRWNWPIEGVKRIVDELRKADRMPRPPALFPNGDPPQPFHESTELCCWMCLQSVNETQQMPDCRWIDFHGLFPIYREEIALIETHGHEELAERLEASSVPLYIDPHRPNAAFIPSGDENSECDV